MPRSTCWSAGRDTLTGGADAFAFVAVGDSGAAAAARDVITDFQDGMDSIWLDQIDADRGTAADDAFAFLAAEGAAFTAAGQVRWSRTDGATLVEASVDADSDAELQIQLTGLKTLSGADFVL